MANSGGEIYRLLRSQLTPVAAAGVEGNLQQESSLDPNAPGGGLDQGQGARAHGGTAAQQIAAIFGELHGSERGTLAALRSARTPQEAARIFSQRFERPGIPMLSNRERYALEALKRYGGLTPGALPGVTGAAGAPGSAGPVATTIAGQPVGESGAQAQDLSSLLGLLARRQAGPSFGEQVVGTAKPGELTPIRAPTSQVPSIEEALALSSKIGAEGSTERGPSAVRVPVESTQLEGAPSGKFAGGGRVPNARGGPGFTPGSNADYTYGHESAIASRLDQLGRSLGLKLNGISGYRTPAHSEAVGGFANDPHTRGEASDTPGIENVPEAVLNRYGLERPFDKITNGRHSNPKEADHIQLLGSVRAK